MNHTPIQSGCGTTWFKQILPAASKVQHVWYPMTTDNQRVNPFQRKNTRPFAYRWKLVLNQLYFSTHKGYYLLGLQLSVTSPADLQERIQNVLESPGLEHNDLRLGFHTCHNSRYLSDIHFANVTEILCQDYIRRFSYQPFLV